MSSRGLARTLARMSAVYHFDNPDARIAERIPETVSSYFDAPSAPLCYASYSVVIQFELDHSVPRRSVPDAALRQQVRNRSDLRLLFCTMF